MQSKSLLRQILLAGVLAVLLVLALQPLFVATLVVTRSHADLAAIRAHITEAYADGTLAADEHPTRFMQGGGHQFTECTGLLLSIDNQPDPLTAALYPQLHSKYRGPCVELQGIAAGHETADRTSYARYWHGYRAYLWPMLSLFSLDTVRAINAVLLYAATLVFFLSLRRAIGVVWLYAHHFFAGIRYLLLDMHWGIDKAPARTSALAVFALGAIATLLVAWRLW